MEIFDLAVLGLTFLGVGAAEACKGSTVIIEPKAKPGYEFIDCYHPITEEKPLITPEVRRFRTYFAEEGLLDEKYIPDFSPYFSRYLYEKHLNILLFTEIIAVEQADGLYRVTLFNSEGYSEIFARTVLDTRSGNADKKTINGIVYGEIPDCKKTEITITPYRDNIKIAEVSIEPDMDYPRARELFFKLCETVLFPGTKAEIISVADLFYIHTKQKAQVEQPGFIKAASDYFPDPFSAYDCGVKIGGELK